MAKIEFFALGGLDEKEKQCYVLNINGDIFIINSGVSTPPNASLGIKKIIPDFNWILQNKNAIKGIFIGYPAYANFGSLEYFCSQINNLPIYTNNIGKLIIQDYFDRHTRLGEKGYDIEKHLHVLEPLKTIGVSEHMKITPIRVITSIPNSLGFIFHTNDGAVIYIDNFIIAPNVSNIFQSDLLEINKITNNKNLLLITGVGQISKNDGFTNPHHRCSSFFDPILQDSNGKVIVGFYDDDIYKVLTLINQAIQKNIPIGIYAHGFEKIFQFLEQNNYLNTKNITLIKDEEIDQTKKCIVIVTGSYHRIFPKLEKIILDDDPKIHLRPEDSFVFAAPTIPGYEKMEAEMFDNVYRTDIKSIHKLSKSILQLLPSSEDHKLLTNILQPKYLIPVNGLYMYLKEFQKEISKIGVDKKNIFLLENGQCINIDDGNAELRKKYIKLEPQFIGNQGSLDVGATSLFEREQMKESGVVLVNLLINRRTKSIEYSNFDVIGVVNLSEDNKKIINLINEEATKQINVLIADSINKNEFDLKVFKQLVRKIFAKQYSHKFDKTPLVLMTIILRKENYNRS
jgi:ribonuclease J